MYEAGRTAQVAREMKQYNICLLGLSETRWLQAGQLRLASGETLLSSGHSEEGAPHTEGVGLMLTPEAHRALNGWEPISSRIITSKVATKKKNIRLNVIQCYAPTNDTEDEKKEDFYQHLQTVLDRVGKKDMTILMGDFNAKIGSNNTGDEEVMGKQGLGEMNENGEKFADLCSLHQLVIGGSIFPHKRTHKATAREITRPCDGEPDRSCMYQQKVQTIMPGCESDTLLLLRLKKHATATTLRIRYNVGLLRNREVKAQFQLKLSNRFQPLQELEDETNMKGMWEDTIWLETCEEVLGRKKTQHKDWISADILQRLEDRKTKKAQLNMGRTRSAKTRAQEEYSAADKEVKRSVKKDKKNYVDSLAAQAEEAAGQGNLKDLYMITKKLANKFQQTEKTVGDKNGNQLTTTEEQLTRWAEHFRELLNWPAPETPPDVQPAEEELDINCSKPSKSEIKKAIMSLKNGKAAGPDEIPAEAIKADMETATNMLYSLFSKIWEREEIPAEWKEGILIKLPKKGDLTDWEWISPLYINFIDYEKAFDSVDRETLWKLLRHYRVPEKFVSLIHCTYQGMTCKVAHAGQLSESFEVRIRVRQECLLSPFLFLLVIDWFMKTTTTGRNNGIQWTLWTQLDDLDFADDLALLSHNHTQMQEKTTRLAETSAGTGLKINKRKTELMKINATARAPVTVGGEPIREVESFVYLGSVVDKQGGTNRDVSSRIGKAPAAFIMLKNIWASMKISMTTKLRLFKSNVKSVLLYGSETLGMTKATIQNIMCHRRIFNTRWPEKISNEELWQRAGQEPVGQQIRRRKWGWIGHTPEASI